MKYFIYPFILSTAFIAAACSDDNYIIDTPISADQKESIAFVVSDEGARLTSTAPNTRAGFATATQIVARFESFKSTTVGGTPSTTDKRSTRTVLKADPHGTDKLYSVVNYLTTDNTRYWDDAFGRYGNISVYAVAVPGKEASLLNNTKKLEELISYAGDNVSDYNTIWKTDVAATNNNIAWTVNTTAQTASLIANEDLCYSNNIQAGGKNGRYVYDFTGDKYPEFSYTPTETDPFPNFSDNYLRFAQADGAKVSDPGKFDKGHLIFNHALSRITVILQSGDGFTSSDGFKFTKNNASSTDNIKLIDMYTTGTLNIKDGTWAAGDPSAINKMAPVKINTSTGTIEDGTYSTAIGTYMAQMLPGYVISRGVTNKNVMEFEIDNNTYFITQDMLYMALTADGTSAQQTVANGYDLTNELIKMQQGKNYKFTITIKKGEIMNITATLADWVDVEGEYALDNSHITVTTKKLEGSKDVSCREINFYRWGQVLDKIYTDDSYTATTYSGNYLADNGAATLTETATNSNIWNTNWYYEDNMTAYHFRTLNNLAAGTNSSNIKNTSDVSSFTMESGDQSTKDYHWGAPLISGATMSYSPTDGYKTSLHQGMIAPKNGVENPINITEFHMMSNINISLVTDSVKNTSDAWEKGPAAVDLKGATITITRFAKKATVDMGTGLITPTYTAPSSDHSATDSDCALMTAPDFTSLTSWWVTNAIGTSTDKYRYAVVPQKLRRSDAADPAEADCVGITITTQDANQYYVIKDLASIKATTVSDDRNQSANQNIERWYPGHTYNYKIKITKKGIENITCTVATWVDVEADEIEIDLES